MELQEEIYQIESKFEDMDYLITNDKRDKITDKQLKDAGKILLKYGKIYIKDNDEDWSEYHHLETLEKFLTKKSLLLYIDDMYKIYKSLFPKIKKRAIGEYKF